MINVGVDSSHTQNLAFQFKDYYLDINRWNIFDDTIPFLEDITKYHSCHIVSNHVPELSILVEELNLSKYYALNLFESLKYLADI